MRESRFIWATTGTGGKLIIINVIVFALIYVPMSILHLMKMDDLNRTIMSYLALPADPIKLLFRPWTLITHMFVHGGILHILFNMITLNFAYMLFNRYLDDRRFLSVYFASGFAGALMFIASVNLFPLFQESIEPLKLVGASAATLGVMVGICSFRPDDNVSLFGLFSIKMRWIALIFVLLDLIQLGVENEGGHLAHLGGALLGFSWAVQLKNGSDITAFLGKFADLFKRKRVSKRPSHLTVAHLGKREPDPRSMNDREKQMRVDEILDKISRSGYDSLSKAEKALLFELSKEK